MIYSLPNHSKHGKINKMPPKAATLSSAVTISGQGDTSIAESLNTDS